MALSNTATPIYYGRFRKAVLEGRIPVCQEIGQEMNRIDALIADPDVWYDSQAINGFIAYCEAELTLTDGTDLKLLDSFKLWAEQIFGWWIFVERPDFITQDDGSVLQSTKIIKKRLINKQYLIVARGSAKSMYASCLQSYFLNIDADTTHQITTAPTMKQAEEVLSPIRTSIIRARGPLFKFLTAGSIQNTTGNRALRQKLVSTKKGIENFLTGSLLEIRAMTIDKLQGSRAKYNTVDEWLSGDTREDVISAMEQSASKHEDWLIVAISSEGTVRNGAGDTIKMELAKILRGEFIAPHYSIWHYKLDDIREINYPDMWVKAAPNLGITVSYETYALDVEKAKNAPASKNDIVAKRFGIPLEGFTYFFTYAETLLSRGRPRHFKGLRCSMGADLSQGDDFCAFTFLFPLNDGCYGIVTRSYITRRTLDSLPGALRHKYQEFINEGSLQIMDETLLDMMVVYDDLEAFIIANDWTVETFGYDVYNSYEFVTRWIAENGPFGVEKVPQGARTESVPLGELKILAAQRMLKFYQGLMSFTMGNAVTKEDTNGNRKLWKLRQEEKIDNVAALMDAYVAYKANKEIFE